MQILPNASMKQLSLPHLMLLLNQLSVTLLNFLVLISMMLGMSLIVDLHLFMEWQLLLYLLPKLLALSLEEFQIQ